jgi:two-component system chemotaxis response regulator CheY
MMSVDFSTPVLVVNDHAMMRVVVTTILKQIGFTHIDGVEDAPAALRKLRGKNYGLVIAEAAMQPISGDEFLHTIHADPEFEAIPVLLMTTPANMPSIPPRAQAITKPFNAQKLQEKISALLAA